MLRGEFPSENLRTQGSQTNHIHMHKLVIRDAAQDLLLFLAWRLSTMFEELRHLQDWWNTTIQHFGKCLKAL